MKNSKTILITTQYMENYGSSETPYMKFKGGSTYLIPGVDADATDNDVATLVAQVRPFVTTTLLETDGGCEEFVIDSKLTSNWRNCVDEYDAANYTSLLKVDGKWTAMKVTDNREFLGMKMQILEKTETWTCGSSQSREDYKASFLMDDGDICESNAELTQWFETREKSEVTTRGYTLYRQQA